MVSVTPDLWLPYLTGFLFSLPFGAVIGWLISKTEFRVIPLSYGERLDGEADIDRRSNG